VSGVEVGVAYVFQDIEFGGAEAEGFSVGGRYRYGPPLIGFAFIVAWFSPDMTKRRIACDGMEKADTAGNKLGARR
jgi:hypothetical protein